MPAFRVVLHASAASLSVLFRVRTLPVLVCARPRLPAADESLDFYLVTVSDHCFLVLLTLDHHDVVLDGDNSGVDAERGEQGADADGAGDFKWLAVQSYGQTL